MHVEGRGRNGLPEHFFSYYLNERGEKVYDGKETEWWSGSFRKSREFNWKDGHRNGMCTYWYSNGNTESKEFFVNDTLDSIFADYYENGQRKTEAHLKNKKAQGIQRHWDSTGQLSELMTFKDGNEEGLHIIWYPNGQKRQEDSTNSQGDGVLRYWAMNGQLLTCALIFQHAAA